MKAVSGFADIIYDSLNSSHGIFQLIEEYEAHNAKQAKRPGYYPILCIGQMIEFLEENTENEFHIFRRAIDWKIIYDEKHYGKILGEGLCDALWEAIKEVLET